VRSRKGAAFTGSVRWSKSPNWSIWPPPRSGFRELKLRFGALAISFTARCAAPTRTAPCRRFAAGETRLLVATTVIEVGVDVPEASVMVIEPPNGSDWRSYISLRGRVGPRCRALHLPAALQRPAWRDGKSANSRSCARPTTASASPKRIYGCAAKATCSARDRAAVPGFRIARLEVHGKYLAAARDDAALTLARDPQALIARGEALRALLYLFARDEAIRLLGAG